MNTAFQGVVRDSCWDRVFSYNTGGMGLETSVVQGLPAGAEKGMRGEGNQAGQRAAHVTPNPFHLSMA